jgi:hypothetical protein
VLPGLKHVELECDSLSLQGVKAGSSTLPGPKHAGLKHDSPSLRWVKVGWVHHLDANTLGSDVLEVIKGSRHIVET